MDVLIQWLIDRFNDTDKLDDTYGATKIDNENAIGVTVGGVDYFITIEEA